MRQRRPLEYVNPATTWVQLQSQARTVEMSEQTNQPSEGDEFAKNSQVPSVSETAAEDKHSESSKLTPKAAESNDALARAMAKMKETRLDPVDLPSAASPPISASDSKTSEPPKVVSPVISSISPDSLKNSKSLEPPVVIVKQVPPVVRPEKPIAKQVQPAVRVEETKAEQVQPVARVAEPVAERLQPAVNVEETIAEKVQPLVRVEETIAEQVQPVVREEEPIAERVQPVEVQGITAEQDQPVVRVKDTIEEHAQPVLGEEETTTEQVQSVVVEVEETSVALEAVLESESDSLETEFSASLKGSLSAANAQSTLGKRSSNQPTVIVPDLIPEAEFEFTPITPEPAPTTVADSSTPASNYPSAEPAPITVADSSTPVSANASPEPAPGAVAGSSTPASNPPSSEPTPRTATESSSPGSSHPSPIPQTPELTTPEMPGSNFVIASQAVAPSPVVALWNQRRQSEDSALPRTSESPDTVTPLRERSPLTVPANELDKLFGASNATPTLASGQPAYTIEAQEKSVPKKFKRKKIRQIVRPTIHKLLASKQTQHLSEQTAESKLAHIEPTQTQGPKQSPSAGLIRFVIVCTILLLIGSAVLFSVNLESVKSFVQSIISRSE